MGVSYHSQGVDNDDAAVCLLVCIKIGQFLYGWIETRANGQTDGYITVTNKSVSLENWLIGGQPTNDRMIYGWTTGYIKKVADRKYFH